MKEENSGTAIVTPDKHSAYMRPIFPKKMHTPEAMAKPIRGAFSCRTKQFSSVQNSSGSCRTARALLCGKQRTQRCSTHIGSCLYEVFKIGLQLLTCANRSCCMNCSFGCGLPAIAHKRLLNYAVSEDTETLHQVDACYHVFRHCDEGCHATAQCT